MQVQLSEQELKKLAKLIYEAHKEELKVELRQSDRPPTPAETKKAIRRIELLATAEVPLKQWDKNFIRSMHSLITSKRFKLRSAQLEQVNRIYDMTFVDEPKDDPNNA